MALIEKKPVVERETASYKLNCSTIALVRCYAEFIGSPQEHVVNKALLYIFRKDREFNEWLRAHDKLDLALPTTAQEGGKRNGRRAASRSLPAEEKV